MWMWQGVGLWLCHMQDDSDVLERNTLYQQVLDLQLSKPVSSVV